MQLFDTKSLSDALHVAQIKGSRMSIDSSSYSTSVGIGSSRHVFGGDLRITLRSSSSEQSLNDIRVRRASVGSDRRMLRSCVHVGLYVYVVGWWLWLNFTDTKRMQPTTFSSCRLTFCIPNRPAMSSSCLLNSDSSNICDLSCGKKNQAERSGQQIQCSTAWAERALTIKWMNKSANPFPEQCSTICAFISLR